MEAQTCASICCVDELAMPLCFGCFFEWNSEDALLYFKSSTEARHSIMLKGNSAIAGTVLPDRLNKLMVKGVQFEGAVLDHADKHAQAAGVFYHKKIPLRWHSRIRLGRSNKLFKDDRQHPWLWQKNYMGEGG